ncbi:MAG TPA: AraC family transcriptional regulator [Casimicrobiaceae bacterium]|nr:AraC family transcriptional regulator [Casimicrobiaceae bacterium]
MKMKAQPSIGRDDGPGKSCNEWRQRVGGFTALPAFLRALDVDPSAVLSGVGLEADALATPDGCIGYGTLGRLLEASSERAAYPHLGLTAGRMWHLDDLGTLGELMRHSPTVGEALQSLVQYQHVHGEGGLAFAAKHGSLVEVGYAIYYPGIAGADQIYDFALAWLFNLLRELCGPGWLPAQVLIPHGRPRDPVHYRNAFKLVPQFDSEVCAIRFPAVLLNHPVGGADPARRSRALAAMRDKDGPDVLQQVFRTLRDLLLNGRSSGNDVALAMSMHRRTLNRRLQQCGTTFQGVLDEVRCEAARQLLCYSEVALDDIAASLGYAGVSPFMRSFRRWTGLSPGQLRRLAVNGRDDIGAVMVHPPRDERADPRAPASADGVADAHAYDVGPARAAPARFAHGVQSAGWPPWRREPAPSRSSGASARAVHPSPLRWIPLASD